MNTQPDSFLHRAWAKVVAIYHAPWFVWLVVALGVLTRLRDYVHNRSLWLDETKIATNLLTRSFAGLLQPLDFEQGGRWGGCSR